MNANKMPQTPRSWETPTPSRFPPGDRHPPARIVSSEPHEDGLGIMRDAQTPDVHHRRRLVRLQPGPDAGKELAPDLPDSPGQGPVEKQQVSLPLMFRQSGKRFEHPPIAQ